MQLPVVIHKHWIGIVFILLVGLGITGVLWFLTADFYASNAIDQTGAAMLLFASVVTILITIVQLWVYCLSYYEINDDGLHVVNWHTLFWKTDTTTEWVRIQDASVTTTSLFSLLFAYGTLTVQTAGTAQTLALTMVPEPEFWSGVIQSLADEATPEI